MTATGVARVSVCQPLAVSLVNVPEASWVPLADHSRPRWVPVLAALVEANAGDEPADVGAELHADFDGAVVRVGKRPGVAVEGQMVHGQVGPGGGAAAVVNDHVTGGVMFPAASRAPVMVTL